MTYTNNLITRAKLATDELPVFEAQGGLPRPRHPIGLNVRQDVNYADVLTFVQKMGGMRSSLFHVDVGSLPRLHDFKPHVDTLIWRPREHTGERLFEYVGPGAYIDFCRAALVSKGFAPGDVWIHLHNESVWSDAVIEWERQAIEHALRNGMRVICLNQAVGNPHESKVHMARPILKLAGERPDSVIIGIHEYFSVWGNRAYPWYLGRWTHTYPDPTGAPSKTKHSFESYRHSVKELKARPVRYIVTEWGADHISDDEAYTNTLPKVNGQISGVHTLSAAWARDYDKPINPVKKPYPGLDTAYFEQLQVAWATGHYGNTALEAALIYGWGREWPLFDISGMSKLHSLLAGWRPIPLETVPEVVIPTMTVNLKGANSLFVRPDPSPVKDWIGQLEPGNIVGYELPTVKGTAIQGNDQWLKVYLLDKKLWGYVSAHYIDLPTAQPEPEPEPPTPTPEPEPSPAPVPGEPTPPGKPLPPSKVEIVRHIMASLQEIERQQVIIFELFAKLLEDVA